MSKECYINKENISSKCREWLSRIPIRKIWKGKIRAENSALLVIDMQKYFLVRDSHGYVPSAEAIIENINKLVEIFSDGLIVYTKHEQESGDEGIMIEWWKEILYRGELSEIDPRITIKGITMSKSRYSPFYKTKLEGILKSRGIENVFVSGVMTDVCCMAAAIEAFIRDFRVFFIVDATATTREVYHVSSLISLSHGYAELILSEDVEKRLNN